MATLIEASHTDWDGKPFWGLVQQNGPWKTTQSDRERAAMKDKPSAGGGQAAGGRSHAGHGEWLRVFTPYQIDGTNSPLSPSDYAMRSVVTGSVDMKRQTKMGRVKEKLTLGARTPFQTGHKMGHAPEEVKMDKEAPSFIEHPVFLPPSFTSDHHLDEITKHEGGPENIYHFGPDCTLSNCKSTIPHIEQHEPFVNQSHASTTAKDDERKDKMADYAKKIDEGTVHYLPITSFQPKRKASIKEGIKKKIKVPEAPGTILGKRKAEDEYKESKKQKQEEIPTQKRKGSVMEGIVKKIKGVGKPGEPVLGKRKNSNVMEVKRKVARTIFKGPMKPEQHNVALKRKAEKQIMSEKFKKVREKEPRKKLTIQTENLGAPFVGRLKTVGARAEKKSAPKKNDTLPEPKPKRR